MAYIPIIIIINSMIHFQLVKWIKDRRRAFRHRLPASTLRKIPISTFVKGDPYDTCAICLDDYMEGEKLRILPCAHGKHLINKCFFVSIIELPFINVIQLITVNVLIRG